MTKCHDEKEHWWAWVMSSAFISSLKKAIVAFLRAPFYIPEKQCKEKK